ncbi:hypothetical protein PCANC_12034 [Puccinia coronata f. sp. avenae]|uniref:Uncharacterized protein n=1 Tax=Puccinia coronata f. sp. avenae TaxID=200324 RepID=A0A2N5UUH3_9BASI|nr:hypothetical protein PCANC_12034 [Puccinia coronata f. sp. avenae]
MSMSMDDIINGLYDDVNSAYPHGDDGFSSQHLSSPHPINNLTSQNSMHPIDSSNLFESFPIQDINMKNHDSGPHSSPSNDNCIDQVCSNLQTKLNLDAEHLKIALLTSKCSPKDMHANVIFANAAYHQLGSTANTGGAVAHIFNDTFRDFVLMKAWMILLILSLKEYSNNPHKNGTLPKTLYYCCLDAVDKQPNSWKADHLAPGQLDDDPTALQVYRGTMGKLLKHQRIHVRTLDFSQRRSS